MTDHFPSVIAIRALKAQVRLGVGDEERARPQEVSIEVRVYLPAEPAAAKSDTAEYLCYHTLSERIHALCMQKEYRLIEYLAHEMHRLLRTLVPKEARLSVQIRKPHILLPYVEQGASYLFTDLPPGASVALEL